MVGGSFSEMQQRPTGSAENRDRKFDCEHGIRSPDFSNEHERFCLVPLVPPRPLAMSRSDHCLKLCPLGEFPALPHACFRAGFLKLGSDLRPV